MNSDGSYIGPPERGGVPINLLSVPGQETFHFPSENLDLDLKVSRRFNDISISTSLCEVCVPKFLKFTPFRAGLSARLHRKASGGLRSQRRLTEDVGWPKIPSQINLLSLGDNFGHAGKKGGNW